MPKSAPIEYTYIEKKIEEYFELHLLFCIEGFFHEENSRELNNHNPKDNKLRPWLNVDPVYHSLFSLTKSPSMQE